MCYTVYSKLVYFVSFTVNVSLGILSSEGGWPPFDSLSNIDLLFKALYNGCASVISIANFY